MSTPAQVEITMDKFGAVYLYTHFKGEKINEIVRNSLSKKWRWNDPEYLARIIFEEMIGDDRGTETGYGIGVSHTGVNRSIEVNCEEQLVTVWEKNECIYEGSFDEFIK